MSTNTGIVVTHPHSATVLRAFYIQTCESRPLKDWEEGVLILIAKENNNCRNGFFFPKLIDQCFNLVLDLLASAPLHTQDTEIGLGALVWQPQPTGYHHDQFKVPKIMLMESQHPAMCWVQISRRRR